jgi:hypothetical protein
MPNPSSQAQRLFFSSEFTRDKDIILRLQGFTQALSEKADFEEGAAGESSEFRR